MTRPNLTREVVDHITRLGRATMDDLLPLVGDYTRQQVRFALNNASKDGLIHCAAPGKRLGAARGCVPGYYVPGPNPNRARPERRAIHVRPPASVWELGHGLQIPGLWPPEGAGRRHAPLGPWNDPNDNDRSAAA